ncbi:hypothetical protein ACXIUS_29650 [Bosea thiooxidans]
MRDSAPVSRGSEAANWALQITPYLWASGLRGEVAPFRAGPTVGVSKSFGDVLDTLNFGGFLHVWHRNGRFVASADAMLVDTTESRAIERVPIFGPVRGLSAKADTREINATLQAGYRIVETAPFTLDLLAGARLWKVSTKVTVSYGNFAVSLRESLDWVDPVIGLRAFYGLTDRLSIQAQGDIGGFGVGSRLTWQVVATANYVLTDRLSLSAGYKILKTDYRSGGQVFDTTLQGPVAGLTYRF